MAELDLAAARPGSALGPDLCLATKATNAVTIPRRVGAALVVTPLDRDGFLRTIRRLVPAA